MKTGVRILECITKTREWVGWKSLLRKLSFKQQLTRLKDECIYVVVLALGLTQASNNRLVRCSEEIQRIPDHRRILLGQLILSLIAVCCRGFLEHVTADYGSSRSFGLKTVLLSYICKIEVTPHSHLNSRPLCWRRWVIPVFERASLVTLSVTMNHRENNLQGIQVWGMLSHLYANFLIRLFCWSDRFHPLWS